MQGGRGDKDRWLRFFSLREMYLLRFVGNGVLHQHKGLCER